MTFFHSFQPSYTMSLAMRPISRPLAGPSRLRLKSTVQPARGMSSVPTQTPRATAPMPSNMPRENYSAPLSYTVHYVGRTLRYVAYGVIGLGATALTAYEGMHQYVEHVQLAAPTRSHDDDTFAWADENQAWTGGFSGGTDPRLGFKARHALRGAYLFWEWGSGDTSTIGSHHSLHPSFGSRRGMIGGGGVRRTDRGYELAEEFIDATITAAEKRGFVFPPELDRARAAGPPEVMAFSADQPNDGVDPTAIDLLLLKAGVLERLNTPETLEHAKELYERVIHADPLRPGPVPTARTMRLAHKIGDLAARSGDGAEAQEWWAWGLQRAHIDLPAIKASKAVSSSSSNGGSSSWWSWGNKSSPAPPAEPASLKETAAVPPLASDPKLAPPVLRAALALLISASAADAQGGSLDAAAAVQSLAISLLPVTARLAVPASSTGPASLQETWLESRAALLNLHRASVAYARKEKGVKPIDLTGNSTDRSEAVLAQLTPILPTAYTSPRGTPLEQPANRLVRDTLLTAAEAYYTHAVFLERGGGSKESEQDRVHRLEHSGECYERAMTLAAAESGTTNTKKDEEDGVGRGEEWMRYWRGYARVRNKIIADVDAGKEVKPADGDAVANPKA